MSILHANNINNSSRNSDANKKNSKNQYLYIIKCV